MKYLILIFLISCAPSGRRGDYTKAPTEEAEDKKEIPQERSDTGTTNFRDEIPPCEFAENSYEYAHTLIGNYNLCFPSEDKSVFHVQVEQKLPYALCFFPLSNLGGQNNETYPIGNKKCASPGAGGSFKVELNKDRPGFGDHPLRGIMVILDGPYNEITPYRINATISQAYQDCMEYFQQTGDFYACQSFIQKQLYFQLLY